MSRAGIGVGIALFVAAACGGQTTTVPSDGGTSGVTCTYLGKTYASGEAFPAGDGCNTCRCDDHGAAECTLVACDAGSSSGSSGGACPDIARLCPDNSYVYPQPPTCEIPACPPADCNTLANSAANDVTTALQAHLACQSDADCVVVDVTADCFDQCESAMNQAGQSDFGAAQSRVDGNQCAQFKQQGCQFVHPPCVAPGTPHCVNQVCELQH